MTENNIISFEEFLLKRKSEGTKDNALTQVLKQDLRKQEDVLDWYLFHNSFNKYKLFLHSLFYKNHQRKKGINPNAGFIVAFDHSQIDSIIKFTEDALKWLGRRFVVIDGKGKNVRQLIEALPGGFGRTYGDFFKNLRYLLLERDYVIVFTELSCSKMQSDKTAISRSLIKMLDDAHFDNIVPRADLIFIDYASFLEKAWHNIGLYIDILPSN
jgi:hypothetical protein